MGKHSSKYILKYLLQINHIFNNNVEIKSNVNCTFLFMTVTPPKSQEGKKQRSAYEAAGNLLKSMKKVSSHAKVSLKNCNFRLATEEFHTVI